MVTTDGRVKVLDFGLAKLRLAASGPPEASVLTTELTTGSARIVGTAAHMSPEQAQKR